MRGKQRFNTLVHTGKGLIPAHAGKTCTWSLLTKPGRAHPRACGENQDYSEPTYQAGGSSPRMRGKLYPRMGNVWNSVAHPRACGENECPNGDKLMTRGSSPRMRGKQSKRPCMTHAVGLIPAHAGKTTRLGLGPFSLRAHPRACGENGCCHGLTFGHRGSSPRMRGKRD